MREQQKTSERRGIDTFQRLCPEAPRGQPQPGETPDFRFQGERGAVGIEIVEYLQDADPDGGSRALARDRSRRAILMEAERVYRDELRGVPAVVTVHWTEERPRKRDEQVLARMLAELTVSEPLDAAGNLWRHAEVPDALRSYVRAVRAMPLSDHTEWTTLDAAWMGTPEPALREILKRKEQTVAACRENMGEVWLLVVAYGEILKAQIIDLQDVGARTYESGFDRVYLLDVFSQTWVRLRVRPPSGT